MFDIGLTSIWTGTNMDGDHLPGATLEYRTQMLQPIFGAGPFLIRMGGTSAQMICRAAHTLPLPRQHPPLPRRDHHPHQVHLLRVLTSVMTNIVQLKSITPFVVRQTRTAT